MNRRDFPSSSLAAGVPVSITKTVGISVLASRLAYWDTKLQAFQVETEPVSLMAGDSSANLPLNVTVNIRQ